MNSCITSARMPRIVARVDADPRLTLTPEEFRRLGHDVIDPDQPYERIGVVYPILEKILAGANP